MNGFYGEYFLGGVTGNGFKTDFGSIIDDGFFTYILKGGPGTGKSSLMRRIAESFADKDKIELYYCSSDPSSLDAVVLTERKVIVADGTAPHVFDPQYPGIRQCVVNLGEYWDKKALSEHAEKIIAVTDENKKLHKRAAVYAAAVSSVNSDIFGIAADCLSEKKLASFADKFSKRLLGKSRKADGKVVIKQLSALTENGYMTNPLPDGYTVYSLRDDCFAASDMLLRKLTDAFVAAGEEVFASLFGLISAPTYEHIIVPSLKIAFISENFFNRTEFDSHPINCARFYDPDAIAAKKQRIAFSKKASAELATEAAKTIGKAKAVHDEIEHFYISAMDFDDIRVVTEQLITEIARIVPSEL